MPQTLRPSRAFGSKQTHHMAKQGARPVHGGSPAPHHLRTPGSCLLPSPESSQEQPLHKPKTLAEAHILSGSPHKWPGWAEGAGPSRKGYPTQGPLDGEERTRRARGRAWGCRSGTAPPHSVPCAEGRGRAPFHHVCGLSRVWRPPQLPHSLHSASCAEGQLNSCCN